MGNNRWDTMFATQQGWSPFEAEVLTPLKLQNNNVPHFGASTVLLRPIVQSYVMKGRELNKFGTCHMSFGPMNIFKTHRK